MRCPICGTYMGTLGNGACGVCAEKYLHLAPPPSEVERLSAENERLASALRWEQHRAERIGTHADDCWAWGPAHYECLLRKYNALAAKGE